MRISIFGMGYVGIVSGACLVRDGHHIMGIDPVQSKVDDLAQGRSPITEPGVAELLAAGHQAGRLASSTDPAEGVKNSDMIWVCVGTPSSFEAGLDLSHVKTVMGQIGQEMQRSGARPLIVLRSTVLPGSTEKTVVPTLEKASGLKAGEDFQVVFHPEFLREGTAVEDFDAPPKIVVGETRPGDGATLMGLYGEYDAPKFCISLGEAEMVKYCDNLFHAVKITFANEVGAIAHRAGVDARRVAEVFCADTKLNISPRYLKPGFAYGGSCLPKDLRAILRYGTIQAIATPMLSGIPDSNAAQIERLVSRVVANKPKTVGMVGLAFKTDTDDMRESPYVAVAKGLIGEGIRLSIYDPNVQVDRLIGSNRHMVENALGHLRSLLVDSIRNLAGADAILVNHNTVDGACINGWLESGIRVIDLVGIEGVDQASPGYEGIAW